MVVQNEGIKNGAATPLQENQNLTHMLNIQCSRYCLALACTVSSSQPTVVKGFESVHI